jgi:hypothetical protein
MATIKDAIAVAADQLKSIEHQMGLLSTANAQPAASSGPLVRPEVRDGCQGRCFYTGCGCMTANTYLCGLFARQVIHEFLSTSEYQVLHGLCAAMVACGQDVSVSSSLIGPLLPVVTR